MASDLSALLAQSKTLTSHLSRPDLPSVHLSLDQVEAQSRRLVSRHSGSSNDTDRANYLLAQAQVDASALSNSIAHINAASTFSPLQPLQDTNVEGYLRHAHEQNILSTIEEGRRETQQEFYRMLEERSRDNWEAKKRRVSEELGGRVGADNKSISDMRKSTLGKNTSTPAPSIQMQSKMMSYDRVIVDFNNARLHGNSFSILNRLADAALSHSQDTSYDQASMNFRIMCKITEEPPNLPSPEYATSTQLLNPPKLERKFARTYLGDQNSRNATVLRQKIAKGAREASEEQYWDVVQRTNDSKAQEVLRGGDPSVAKAIQTFVMARFHKNGQWQERIELVAGHPIWATIFFLVRTGHVEAASNEAIKNRRAIESRETNFVDYFKTWVTNDRCLPKPHRDDLQAVYNAHMLHSNTTDPFKLAIYKLMGKLEPSRRNVPFVTTTTEDWLWFQLSMVDENEEGGLRGLAEVLLGYGQRHFDGAPNQPNIRQGIWAGVLLMCGQFERAVAALWEHQETEVEAVHMAIALSYHGLLRVPPRAETSDLTPLTLSPGQPPAISVAAMIWRYIRQFVKMDAKEALQYVCCVCLTSDQGDGVGKEQVESAWELVRRIIVQGNSGPGWEELVGGFRTDGTRFSGIIERVAVLLKLEDTQQFNEEILIKAARTSDENDRMSEAIRLYNLAGDYPTVIACLAQALGNTIALASPDERAKSIEKTAADMLRNYERTNRAVGKDRDAVIRLLRIREALDAKAAGRHEAVINIMESTDLIPLDGDVAKITRRADEFKLLHDSLQRNLPTYLSLTMDSLASIHQKIKDSMAMDATRQVTLADVRKKSRSLIVFAGILKYRMSPDVYSYLARLDVEIAL